jgi:hypothetical protein
MTPRETAALDTIRSHIQSVGIAPTLNELSASIGVSKAGAHRIVGSLEAMNKVRRRPGKVRGIELPCAVDLRTVTTDDMRAELARRGVTMDALARPRALNYGRQAVTCAADSCHVEVRRGHLMCWDHWSQLPRALQQEILNSFGRRDKVAYGDAVRRARDLIDGGRA